MHIYTVISIMSFNIYYLELSDVILLVYLNWFTLFSQVKKKMFI